MLNSRNKLKTRLRAGISLPLMAVMIGFSAAADEGDGPFNISANVSIVNDYRFRGVSLSDEDFALQGGIDVNHESGLYLGTWGSSIETFNGSELELDIYGGFGIEIDDTSLDLGVMLFSFPGGTDTNYWEVYGSAGRTIGSIDLTAGFAYAPSQDNIGNEDSIYLYGSLTYPLANTPFSLLGHIGFEDGAFGDDRVHWIAGVTFDYGPLSFGVSYLDTNERGDNVDATVLFSVGASF